MNIHIAPRLACPLALCSGALAILMAGFPATSFADDQKTTGEQNAVTATAAEPEGFLPEPAVISKMINILPRSMRQTIGEGSREKNGFYPEFSNMPTGAGWISAGPGYRHWLLHDQALVDASAAVSWRSYKMAQARFELPQLANSRFAVGTQIRWQDLTQVSFFGDGPDALEANRSEYRLKSTNTIGYATMRPVQWVSIRGGVGWLNRPSILAPAGKFQRGNPDARELFGDDVVYSLSEQPNFVHGDASIVADTRDHRSHPTTGGLYRAGWSVYSDRDTGLFNFNRYEAEAAQFVPLASSRVVLAVHGWLVTSSTQDGDVVPFYLMPSLGGSNTVRAYTDFRFHDRNMMVLNAESRIALFTHIDAAAFVDAGNVAPRVGDLNLDKRGYGVGLRMHTRQSTFARFDVVHGDEGWRFLFRMNDPLHLSRLSRRTAAVPFVP
jgi:hypothetical protein